MEKIILDCERMKYQHTGLFHYCMNLGLSLEKHLKDAEIVYYSPANVNGIFNENNCQISQNSLHKFVMPQLNEYQLWHATYQNTNYMPLRNKRIKVVLTVHDLNFMYDETKPRSKTQKYLAHLQNNIDRSDAIVCISEFAKSDVLKYCNVGRKLITVIHNGTNALKAPTLSPTSYKPLKKFLFSIGVVTRKKNFHALLPLLEDNDLELLIAGKNDDTEYHSYLIDSAKQVGVEEKLRLLGTINENEKSWYFTNCYAFATSSTAEGFCMPLTEAMSVGKPLFLSDLTALPEIGGRVAFYFSDFNKNNMQRTFLQGMNCYESENLQQSIKERGADFCWDKAAKQYIEVYRSLL